MTQDVTVESTADVADNDVTVEDVQKQEPTNEEVESQTDETESEEGEGEEEQTPKTVEERLAEAEERAEKAQKAQTAMQKKIDRQTKANSENLRALEQARKEAQEAVSKSQEVNSQEPSIDDYDTHDEYVEAVTDWKAEQKVQAKEAEFKQRQELAKRQEIANERAKIANEQEAEYLKVNPRYEASKSEFQSYIETAKVSPDVEDAIVSMAYKGNVPELINYFGENNGERITELETISAMSPVEAAVEIYKIQQTLVTPKKEEKKPLPKPVKAAPAAKSKKSLEKSSGKDVMAWVNS